MIVTLKVKPVSSKEITFKNKKGESDSFTKIILLDEESNVWEVSTSDKSKVKAVEDHLMEEIELECKLYKDKFGLLKLSI